MKLADGNEDWTKVETAASYWRKSSLASTNCSSGGSIVEALCVEKERIKTLRNDSLLVHGHIEYKIINFPEQEHVWQKALLPDDRIPVSLFPPKKNKNYQSTGQQKENPKKEKNSGTNIESTPF